jgi:hypothetical protein
MNEGFGLVCERTLAFVGRHLALADAVVDQNPAIKNFGLVNISIKFLQVQPAFRLIGIMTLIAMVFEEGSYPIRWQDRI